jgi:hypothetical protein
MDGADAFLHRKELRALQGRRKKEKFRVVAPVQRGQQHGLLAITATRILFSRKRGFGAKAEVWRKQAIGGCRVEKKGPGVLQIKTNKGIVAFAAVRRGDAARLLGAITPQAAPPPPRPPGHSIPDPTFDSLAHRGTAVHRAKLQQLVADGTMTQAEMDWQLAA